MLDVSEYDSSSNVSSSFNDFITNDEYIDDELIPNYESDRDSETDSFLVGPEGLNLINPFNTSNDTSNTDYSDLDHYLLDPEGLNLGNYDAANDLVIGLDPEPSPGPIDPG